VVWGKLEKLDHVQCFPRLLKTRPTRVGVIWNARMTLITVWEQDPLISLCDWGTETGRRNGRQYKKKTKKKKKRSDKSIYTVRHTCNSWLWNSKKATRCGQCGAMFKPRERPPLSDAKWSGNSKDVEGESSFPDDKSGAFKEMLTPLPQKLDLDLNGIVNKIWRQQTSS
jgi:hypothetical protein